MWDPRPFYLKSFNGASFSRFFLSQRLPQPLLVSSLFSIRSMKSLISPYEEMKEYLQTSDGAAYIY